MNNHLVAAPLGAAYTPRLVCTTGDRLIHPADSRNDLARIVVRWARRWVPETWPAREYFDALGIGDAEVPCYDDESVTGWLLMEPQPDSLAWQVRTGRIDIATALTAEAEAWPDPRKPLRPQLADPTR
ncbi:hypothetical protein SAMN04489729_7900 [Amycolatopsis lurida]|uniref:Uncharacterized protein n=1 Tax=Amycolatopsis lurida NRRL 2430 TaxID=1460371 RepID=A0A2P2FIX9_AMYLU|nr:hypothetical protein [Amycolatopsis lurida]KFU76678.1 hypothetical protein BB31_35165 [Amycolatopsis lurida NRRL 2430]SEE52635.1 hypothetical protein SAMN04489729_7900 [Amycolatopsis lurida]